MHPSSTWFVVGARLLVTLGYQGMRMLLTMHLTQMAGIPSEQAHTISQAGWLAATLGQPLGGAFADRMLGPKIAAAVGAGVMATGFIVMMVQQPAAAYLGVAIVALGEMLFKPNSLVVLGNGYTASEHTRVAGFAIDQAAQNIAYFGTGIISSMFMSSFGFSFAMVPCILAASGGAALLFFATDGKPKPSEVGESTEPERPSRMPLLLFAAGAAAVFLIADSVASHAMFARLSPGGFYMYSYNAGTVLGLIGAVAVAVYWSSGMRMPYGESLGMWLAVGLGLIGFAALCAGFLPSEGGSTVGFMLVSALNTAADLALFPMLYATVTAAAPGKWRSTVVGGWSALFALPMLTRTLFGLLPESIGIFAAAGGLLAVGGAVFLFTQRFALSQWAIDTFAGEEQGVRKPPDPNAPPAPDTARTDLLVGGITLALGIGITAASFAAAGGGGRYFVTTGLIIFGIFRLGRGLMRLGQ